MFLGYRNCPHCDAVLDIDTEIFEQDGAVIGCEYCVRQTWPEFDEEDDEEEMYADHCDFLNDMARDEAYIERMFA